MTPNTVSTRRWNISGIQARVFLLVGLGVLSTIIVLGWIAWRSLALFSDSVLKGRETLAASVAVQVDQAVVRELKTLQQIAAAPGTDPQLDDDAAKLAALKAAYLRSELTSTARSSSMSEERPGGRSLLMRHFPPGSPRPSPPPCRLDVPSRAG